jgi:prepilin-type N-terminal cleavage/methylation domain-containing protein
MAVQQGEARPRSGATRQIWATPVSADVRRAAAWARLRNIPPGYPSRWRPRLVECYRMRLRSAHAPHECSTNGVKQGFTLVELLMTLALASVFGLTVLMTADSTARAFRTGATVGELERKTRDVLQRISARLESADIALAAPQLSAPFHSAWIDYQRVIGYTAGARDLGPPERIILESSPTDPDDGVDNDGNGVVDDCRIVWIENPGLATERRVVLATWIPEFMEGEIDGNLADDNGNGLEDERGLSFDFSDNQLTIRLTIQRRDADGILVTRSLFRTLTLRNG